MGPASHRELGRSRQSSSAESTTASDRSLAKVLAACDSIGEFIESWGFKSIHGRIWALLAMSRQPLAQTEVADILGVSRSLVSLAMAELDRYGLVRATADHRNAPYEARFDVWSTITDVLRSREWMLIEKSRVTLEAALLEVESIRSRGYRTDFDPRRIRVLLRMSELAQVTLKALFALKMPRSFESFDRWLDRAIRMAQEIKKRLPRLL